ncbi:MAG: hypothetical protein J6A15_00465 [Clostridia bacterium]|nr:hypothetical protein [Clostridia bacterium]
MVHYVQDFFKMYQRYDTIKEEIKEIIKEHEHIIAWSNSDGKIYEFNLNHNSFTVFIKATDIPYSLINELNKYVGKNCKMIGKTSNHISITWRI